MRPVTTLLPLFAVLIGLAPQSPVADRPQGAPADLWIDAVALDSGGSPVKDLRREEIEVWIAGLRIPLLEAQPVTPIERGRTVVLILDNAAIGPALAPRVREAADAFAALMEAGDTLGVVSLHGGQLIMSRDPAEVRRAIAGYRPQGLPFRPEDAGRDVLAAIAAVSRHLAESGEGRKAIAAIGAGWLFDTPLPPPGLLDLRAEWVAAVRATAHARASVYVIDPAGLGMVPGRTGGTSGFARETGGQAFLQTNDLRGAAARVWQEAGHYYLLGVANPPVQRSADLRELELRVLRRGVTVRARRAIAGRPY